MFKILCLLISVCAAFSLYAQESEELSVRDTAKIGVYIISLYDLDFPANELNVDFYVWYNSKNDSLRLLETFELINAKDFTKMGETSERIGEIVYESMRCKAKIKKEWDVRDFPFDKQMVEIIIEDIDKDNTELIFIPDTAASMIDEGVHLEGWEIRDYTIKVIDHTYKTTYGHPSLKPGDYSTYSRVVVYFNITRAGGGLFFKLFIGLFISVLIALVTFFINPTDLDPRFGLSVGAIFAAIASQYVITSTLPVSQQLTLVDLLHDISFVYIFLCILISVISLYLMKNNRGKISVKLDKYSFFVLIVSYIVIASIIVAGSI
jgi:hypothetical protein